MSTASLKPPERGTLSPDRRASLRRLLEPLCEPGGDPIRARDLDPDDLAGATEILEEAVREGRLRKKVQHRARACGHRHPADVCDGSQCPEPNCNRPFDILDDCRVITFFIPPAEEDPHQLEWLLVLHGMNTRGGWQEDLNWLVSQSYGHMVPVAIYKYGVVRPGVLWRRRHAQLRDQLIRRIKSLRHDVGESGFGLRPDVLAHSFGTLLLGQALRHDPDLQVGRVILTGCIQEPDFDWRDLIDNGQVDAVLNHWGAKDLWAAVAHYVIPGSGPAGRGGFDRPHPKVLNVEACEFSHSQFFETGKDEGIVRRVWRWARGRFGAPLPPAGNELEACFETVWQPFLELSPAKAASRLASRPERAARWQPRGRLLRAGVLRWLTVVVGLWLAVLLVAILAQGTGFLWNAFPGVVRATFALLGVVALCAAGVWWGQKRLAR